MWFILLGGIVSGILSNYTGRLIRLPLTFNFWPGIWFGVLILLLLKRLKIKLIVLPKQLVFIIFSVVAWAAAYWAAYFVASNPIICPSEFGPCAPELFFGLFVGGAVGALILCAISKILFGIFKLNQILILTIVSGILGMVGFFAENLVSKGIQFAGGDPYSGSQITLFVVWQVGMSALMNYFLKQNPKILTNE